MRHTEIDREMSSADLQRQFSSFSDRELRRHWKVSFDNRHKCNDCFCCKCGMELKRRKETS